MLYYANPSSEAIREAMATGELGLIRQPGQRNLRSAIDVAQHWVADTGCYSSTYLGDPFWWGWLNGHRDVFGRCRFATAPDVVGDAELTLERSAPWLPRIRDLGIPAALVAQDGLTVDTTPWPTFDALFIGGTTMWKLGPEARELTAQARAYGKPVHMGRVNSHRRLMYAAAIGCTSVDGTYLRFGPDINLARLRTWLAWQRNNPTLEWET